MTRVGVVVIGRNEGARLTRCLESVALAGVPFVYADSGSSDDSVERARAAGARVVALDPARPFSAARGRNEGFARLVEIAPEVRFVQFVDGDCELAEGWLETGARALEENPTWVLVCGALRERHREASIYNRLCEIEWDAPSGPIRGCGGLLMIRREPFEAGGGFDASVIAGEEQELCHRLLRAGGELWRVAEPMAFHDANMHRFAEWWTRQRRCAYGELDVALRFGHRGLGVASVWGWTVGWAGVGLAALVAAALLSGPTAAMGIALLAIGLPFAQALRVARRTHHEGRAGLDALAHGVFTLLSKWPRLQGQIAYRRDRAAGLPLRLIEYRALRQDADA